MCYLFPSFTDEWPFQDHLPSRTLLTLTAPYPKRSEQWMLRACFTVSLLNSLLFQDHLPNTILPRTLCPETPYNEHVVSLPVSLMNGHLKDIFQVELYWLEELCPGRVEQWLCRVSSPSLTTEWPTISRHHPSITLLTQSSVQGDMNGHFKTIFRVDFYWIKELCPGRPQ